MRDVSPTAGPGAGRMPEDVLGPEVGTSPVLQGQGQARCPQKVGWMPKGPDALTWT